MYCKKTQIFDISLRKYLFSLSPAICLPPTSPSTPVATTSPTNFLTINFTASHSKIRRFGETSWWVLEQMWFEVTRREGCGTVVSAVERGLDTSHGNSAAAPRRPMSSHDRRRRGAARQRRTVGYLVSTYLCACACPFVCSSSSPPRHSRVHASVRQQWNLQ